MPTPTTIAIIAGAGPGTGASLAHKFARTYPVALLTRNPASTASIITSITRAGGTAIGIPTDVSDTASVRAMITRIKEEWGEDVRCKAAIFNAAGAFVRKPFLELTEEDLDDGYKVNVKGAFNFSQATLPLLLAATSSTTSSPAEPNHPPTLIFTGATASVKSSALFAAFASTKFALRAMAQSLAREMGPRGVHVAHAVIDGAIDIEKTKAWDLGKGGKIEPGAIADAYWHLHTQPTTAFTWEIDIRPAVEKW